VTKIHFADVEKKMAMASGAVQVIRVTRLWETGNVTQRVSITIMMVMI